MALGQSLRRLATCALGAFAAAFAPGQSLAAPPNGVHVVELASDFDYRAHAQALTSLLRLRLSDGGFALASENVSLVQAAPTRACDLRGFDPSVLHEGAGRGVDARCERAMAARLGAARVVWGYLYTAPDGTLWVEGHFWQGGGPSRGKTLPFDAGARERTADRLYLHLVRPDEAADVRVRAPGPSPAGGELYVDGEGQGPLSSSVELTLKAGEHAFELRREGRAVARAKAAAVAGKTTDVQLAPAPAAAAPAPGPPPLPPPDATGPRNTWRRPVGFVGLGLGVALLGAGAFASARVRGLGDDFDAPGVYAYRESVGRERDACDAAEADVTSARPGAAPPVEVRDLCARASRYEVMQYVFYALGAASIGAGAYLLVSAPPARAAARPGAPRTAWALRPALGGRAAGLSFGGEFF
jgi:hypothetical protein